MFTIYRIITYARYCCIHLPSPVANMFQLHSTYCPFVNFSLIERPLNWRISTLLIDSNSFSLGNR